jgi:glutaredoxin
MRNLVAGAIALATALTLTPAGAVAQECRDQTVVMLSTSWCGYCRKARAFFYANDIEFEEIDAERTSSNQIRQLYRRTGVPFIFVGRETVSGFDEPRLRELLCLDE